MNSASQRRASVLTATAGFGTGTSKVTASRGDHSRAPDASTRRVTLRARRCKRHFFLLPSSAYRATCGTPVPGRDADSAGASRC